jgi:hypothetical protein
MSRPDDDADRSRDESSSLPRSIEVTEIVREMLLLADPSGDLQQDLDVRLDHGAADPDEVWFDAELLAAASSRDLGADLEHDHLGHAPTFEALLDALDDPGISLAQLPGWPGAGQNGQGLGPLADQWVGSLGPGDLVRLGGSGPGVGRTSLLAQLGDGLALADEPGRPSTPVVFVSADPPRIWRARSLARWFGLDARVFFDPHQARTEPRLPTLVSDFARGPWADLDVRQRFVDLDAFAPKHRTTTVMAIRRFAHSIAERGDQPWPIVIVDSIASVAALTELAELAVAEGWIVLVSGEFDDDPARARAVDRHTSVGLRISPIDDRSVALESCHRRLGPRGVVRLVWDRASGRFSPGWT